MSDAIADVLRIYKGSNGEVTLALYKRLETMGPAGMVALNLFRACKCSERAKVYRGGNAHGRYRDQAYERKQFSIDNLCKILTEHAHALGIVWGWGRDEKQGKHDAVLYVEIPTGQVSFHTEPRGEGPDYPAAWDGARGQSADRICRWTARLLDAEKAAA